MRRKLRSFSTMLGLALMLWCAALTFAQQEGSETIRIPSRLVNIEVLVTDKRTGARVDELKKEDFEVFDDGRLQSLTHFSHGADVNRPLALALLVDVRGTTKAVVPHLRAALQQALVHLQPEDTVAVFDFWRGYEMVQELTHDRAQVLEALLKTARHQEQRRSEKGGKPSDSDMAAAILAAMRHMQERQPSARAALVVISDDLNATPRSIVDETNQQLLAEGATVSGLIKVSGLFASTFKAWKQGVDAANLSPWRPGENLAYYSAQTGGEIVNVRGDDYSNALEQVIGNIVGRYSLGFVPDKARLDGRLHKLTVKLKVPAALGKERNLVVRARRAYMSPKDVL